MAHKRFRECDGVRYVTNRIKNNPNLNKTVSDAPKPVRRKRIMPKARTIKEFDHIIELKRQVESIGKVLKSHKPKANAPLYNASYPVIDRRM